MKIFSPFALIFFIAAMIFSASPYALAQKDPKAKSILDAMSKKYKSLKGMKAEFEFTYIDGNRSQKQTGQIAVKGDKYHLKLPEQEIFNNGKTIWTYIESGDYKEVTISNAGEMEDELTPSSIYTIYQKGFDYRLVGEKKMDGKTVQEVELISTDSDAPFSKVNLFVDKEKTDLVAWEIHDDQGGVFKYQFSKVENNVDIPDAFFSFDPKNYGKVEIIDLR